MSGQPQKPVGPPPSGPPPGNEGAATPQPSSRRPPGPPPGAPPVTALKPPPMAPPPRSLFQQSQRPAFESVKTIDTSLGDSLRGGMQPSQQRPGSSAAGAFSGRGPPPRGFSLTPELTASDAPSVAIRKEPASQRVVINQSGERKTGAIAMFEGPSEEEPPLEPADKKMREATGGAVPAPRGPPPGPRGPPRPTMPSGMPAPSTPGQPPTGPPQQFNPSNVALTATSSPAVRMPRPMPPRPQAPGIPEGQPFPPDHRPPNERNPPPAAHPVPNRNRAPPRADPDGNIPRVIPDPLPPDDSEPPFLRGKRAKQEEAVFVKRRERDMPEFESSSDDEAAKEKQEFLTRAVRQPKGLPKQKMPEPRLDDEDADGPVSAPVALVPRAAVKPSAIATKATTGAAATADATANMAPGNSMQPADNVSVADTFDTSSFVKQENMLTQRADKAQQQREKVLADAEAEKARVERLLATGGRELDQDQEDLTESDKDAEDEAEEIGGISQSKRLEELAPEVNVFAAPPASAYTAVLEDSVLARTLPRGRLSIKVIEGYNIRRANDNSNHPRTDPFVKLKLGAADRHPWKATEVQRKQKLNPNFNDEVVYFDIKEPAALIFQDDLQLVVEVWNKSTLRDEIIGNVTMSVVRFLKEPYVLFQEVVPLLSGTKKTESKIKLEFVFEEARSGMFAITLYEAHGLRNVDPLGNQSPYVRLSLGDSSVKKSNVIKSGGTEPYFSEQEVLMWVDQENWIHDLRLDLLDELMGAEKPIGFTHFSLLPYMKNRPEDAKEDKFDLFYIVQLDPRDDREKKEVAQGEISIRVKFMPAGKLTVKIEKAKDLRFPEHYKPPSGDLTRMDPYATATLDGQCVQVIRRTPADKDGGQDPSWDSTMSIDVVDQYNLLLEVFNQPQGGMGTDVLLGSVDVSLLTVYRNGHTQFWTTLRQKKANGGIRESGDVLLELTFAGPPGISYPQCRPEIDSFDDTVRKEIAPDLSGLTVPEEKIPVPIGTLPPSAEEIALEEARKERERVSAAQRKGTLAAEAAKALTAATDAVAPDPASLAPEFTEDEVIAAFKFIDLDHNNFVGAAEIRHILVCMGEMITDEEIDMMISMVDSDGDGQVSLQEFRALVLHPNPAEINLHKEISAAKDKEVMEEKQALAGKSVGLDLRAFQRQKELTSRERKKKVLSDFVHNTEATFPYVKASYQTYLELPKEKRPGGRIKFDEFCHVLQLEPITEYRNMHKLFDTEELGDADFREFLLSMMNFTDVERETRIRFTFTMFDELKTGYITKKEVEEILRGNHMISLASVQRKAETIMRQASANSAGSITMNEFVVISKKFPNILLPAVGPIAQVGAASAAKKVAVPA